MIETCDYVACNRPMAWFQTCRINREFEYDAVSGAHRFIKDFRAWLSQSDLHSERSENPAVCCSV